MYASNINASNSSLNIFSIFGLKILIATSLFSFEILILAKCTCAIEAAATASEMLLIFFKVFCLQALFSEFLLRL